MKNEDKNYMQIFEKYSGTKIGYLKLFGNVGDQLIESATFELLKKFEISPIIVNPNNIGEIDKNLLKKLNCVFIAGGGSLGKNYQENYQLRLKLRNLFPQKIIVLPQTLTDQGDEIHYDEVWLREKRSFDGYQGNKFLGHDLAFAIDLSSFYELKANCQNGILLREDREKLIDNRKNFNLNDPIKMAPDLKSYIKLASTFERIITDRLHFAIIAMKLNRKVILLANAYHKNESVFLHSIKDNYPVLFAKSLEEALNLQ